LFMFWRVRHRVRPQGRSGWRATSVCRASAARVRLCSGRKSVAGFQAGVHALCLSRADGTSASALRAQALGVVAVDGQSNCFGRKFGVVGGQVGRLVTDASSRSGGRPEQALFSDASSDGSGCESVVRLTGASSYQGGRRVAVQGLGCKFGCRGPQVGRLDCGRKFVIGWQARCLFTGRIWLRPKT